MFITKTSLSRRAVLRGMGATLALPFLDAMVPAGTALARTAAAPALRFGAVFIPMGERPGFWTPKTVGRDFEFSPILEPLKEFRDHLVVVSNTDRPAGGTHAVSTATWLTGSSPKRTEAEDFLAGISLDQVLAPVISRDTVFPSLEISTEDQAGYIGACDVGYSCAYMSTIAWKGPTAPLPMERNPRVVFERLFGRPGSVEERVRRMKNDQSILDSVRDDVASLQRDLGARDRVRLTEYLEHVREIEARIERAEKQAQSDIAIPEAPVGIPPTFEEHVLLMFELMAVAYETDLTRVFTFMMNREASQLVFPNLGINEPWHHISHHGNDPAKLDALVKINTWQIDLFGRFLARLKATPDGDGSLLDHSLILWGSGMSDSNTHSALDVPLLVAGGGAGRVKGNRHVAAPRGTQLANAMLDIAQKCGAEIDTLGVSTGRLEI
jgi:hypothetical protein